MKTIVTLTMNPTIDVTTSIDYVVAEEKLRCKTPGYEPGGGGINVSRAIKKLGGESIPLYTSGGATGRMLESLLEQEGLRHQPLPIEGRTRENFIVFEESTGRQFRFGMPGPVFLAQEWERIIEKLTSIEPRPDYVAASGSLPPDVPMDFYARIARIRSNPHPSKFAPFPPMSVS